MFIFFLFIIWIWILITVFVDIFRRKDISGLKKVLWLIFVIVLPYLGVFIYLVTKTTEWPTGTSRRCRRSRNRWTPT